MSIIDEIADEHGVPLIQHRAYYGDVSAIKFLLSKGASLDSLGEDLGLAAACFHGHWQLCKFLLDSGADTNRASEDNGETPLHAALCKSESPQHTLVVKILLAHGANPNRVTKKSMETGGFIRDVRTRPKLPFTALPLSPMKRPSNPSSTPVPPSTPKI